MNTKLDALTGKRIASVNQRSKMIVLSNGAKLKVEVIAEASKPEVQHGAVAEIRKLWKRGKSRAQIIAAGFNPHTVSTQLYRLNNAG